MLLCLSYQARGLLKTIQGFKKFEHMIWILRILKAWGLDFDERFAPVARLKLFAFCLHLLHLKVLGCIKWMLRVPF